jgi:stage II sporulation protein AA (anti-sigma F factor antagonist)
VGGRRLEVIRLALDGTARLDPTAEPRLSVELEIPKPPGPIRIVLAGELDGEEVPRLREAVAGVPIAGDGRDLRVEAADLTFLDSSGIRALLVFRERAAASGVRVVLGPVTRNIYRVMEIAGLVDIFRINAPPSSD